MDCYKSIEELISFCRKYGFVKNYMIEAYNLINRILLKNHLHYDALVKIE